MSISKQLLPMLLIATLAACGGGGNNAQNAANAAGSAAAGAANSVASAGGAMASAAGNMAAGAAGAMAGAAAAVPASLHCGAVQPVWVNPRTHVYHEPSDPMYGKTKHGMYMCPAAAVKAGYHKASGMMGKHKKSSSSM